MDWQNKRVMVTGGAGFIGRHLVEALFGLGADVTNYDIEYGQDILDARTLYWFLTSKEIGLVYHLAAQPIVRLAELQPKQTYETNCEGTLNVLDACAKLNIPLIIASTDKVYGEGDYYNNDTPLNPKQVYETSKAVADLYARDYQRRGANVKIVRFANIYGPGDRHDSRLIPHVVRSYLQGKPPVLRGNLDMLREWLYVDDAVQWYIDIAAKLEPVYSIGGEALSVGAVVDVIRERIGGDAPIMQYNAEGEIQRQTFETHGGRTPFGQGIDKTIAWWRDWA